MMELTKWIPYLAWVMVVLIGIGLATGKKRQSGELITIVTLGVYLVVVGYLTLTPTSYAFGEVPTTNPVWVGPVPTNPFPFSGLSLDFYLNVVMMIPMGVYAALVTNWRNSRIFLASVLIGLGIEMIQFMIDWLFGLARWVDINDVLTNMVGFLIGYGVLTILQETPFKRVVDWFTVK
ncbi:VanZ family protein [Secundilactobacillus kimchicus]|nr:VanZ family protein [Secundilactobacillus kimchicus]